jgi:hypothetical protein
VVLALGRRRGALAWRGGPGSFGPHVGYRARWVGSFSSVLRPLDLGRATTRPHRFVVHNFGLVLALEVGLIGHPMDLNTHSTERPPRPDGLATVAAGIDQLAADDLDRLPDAVVAEQPLALRQLLDRLDGLWLQRPAVTDGRGRTGPAGHRPPAGPAPDRPAQSGLVVSGPSSGGP